MKQDGNLPQMMIEGTCTCWNIYCKRPGQVTCTKKNSE